MTAKDTSVGSFFASCESNCSQVSDISPVNGKKNVPDPSSLPSLVKHSKFIQICQGYKQNLIVYMKKIKARSKKARLDMLGHMGLTAKKAKTSINGYNQDPG